MNRDLVLPAGGALIFWAEAFALLALNRDCPLGVAALLGLALTLGLAAAVWPLRRCSPRVLAAAILLSAALLLGRLLCFGTVTSDYRDFLLPWTQRLGEAGGLKGLGQDIGNYNVPYLTFLALFSYLPGPPLYPIKLLSLLFDLLLAAVLSQLAGNVKQGQTRCAVCFVLTLALPTVFINGAVWGQCDSIYVSLALLGLLLCLRGRPGWGMAAFGLSFAFKLQAIFLLPIVLPLLLRGKVKWFHLPLFPAAYCLAVLPGVLAGRSVGSVLLFYLDTASTAGSSLNYNSPSIFSLYYFYRLEDTGPAAKAGVIAAFAVCLVVGLLFLLGRKRATERSLLLASLLLTLALPLLLPHMHERYFYFVDVLTLCLACRIPALSPTVLLSQFASLLGYHAYFFMRYLLPMRNGLAALCLVLVSVLVLLLRELFSPPERAAPPRETP